MKLIKLYFGMDINDEESYVSDNEFSLFVQAHIAPKFKGFTIYKNLEGCYNGNYETTWVVEIATPLTEKVCKDIAYIKREYCRLFNQDSVGEVTVDCTAKF